MILVDGTILNRYIRIRDEGFHQTQHICIEGGIINIRMYL